MNILLFGGSFNPPHLGHQIVIEQAFELIQNLDECWLLPNFNHTFGKDLSAANHRLEMCKLLIGHLPAPRSFSEVGSSAIRHRTKLCPIEIDHQTSGSTYQTLQLLKTENKYLSETMNFSDFGIRASNFSFLMGSDQLPSFTKWQNWEKLLEEMHFYVYPRAGHRHDITFPHMTLLESPTQVITNISSTLIRNRLQDHTSIDSIVPHKIRTYLTSHHLYQHPRAKGL